MVSDGLGRPLRLFLTAGQISDYTGAAALLRDLPKADHLLADRGYDADWFREGLKDKKINPCIPPRKNRTEPVEYDKELYKKRHKIENSFARIKDWRRIAMRYDRCPITFFSAIILACIVLFWL
jgi:transposase